MNAPAPSPVEARILTITSVFTLHDPANQDTLFGLLSGNAADTLEHTKGFLGSTLSRSDDNTTVVHHATWHGERAVQAMLTSDAARAHMARTRQLAFVRVIRSTTTTHYRAASEAHLDLGSTPPRSAVPMAGRLDHLRPQDIHTWVEKRTAEASGDLGLRTGFHDRHRRVVDRACFERSPPRLAGKAV